MNALKYLTIGFAVVLAAVIGYSFYLHFGPIQKVSNQNSRLKAEIAELQKASGESAAGCQAAIDEKTRTLNDLQKALSEARQETTTIRADLQTQDQVFKDELARREQEISASRHEIENLQQTVAGLNSRLLESKNQFEGLSQQMAATEKQLAEMAETRQGLIRQVDLLNEEKGGLQRQLEQSRVQLNSVSRTVASKEDQLKTIAETQARLEKQLQQQIQEKDLKISALEDKLKIQMLDSILFNPGNAVITPRGRKVLKNLAAELKVLQGIRLSVEGHTDNQPLSEEARAVYHDNLGLSVARAAAVSRMIRVLGVDPGLISAAGYSMYSPVSSNETPEGQQLNRRVEIILMPLR